MGHYCIAQICSSGHLITGDIERYPERCEDYCSQCLKPTITKCPNCGTYIKGYYRKSANFTTSPYKIPNGCYKCGKPFPWTEAKIKTARILISEDKQLSSNEKQTLSQTLPDIISDTPNTQLAVSRYKRLIEKATTVTGECLKQTLIGIAVEVAKQKLWP